VTLQPFYLFLRWLALESDSDLRTSSSPSTDDIYQQAARHLSNSECEALVSFIDGKLAANHDAASLARLFEDGHLHFVWKAKEGPQTALSAIRDAAVVTLQARH
jgi:hypothetical protein